MASGFTTLDIMVLLSLGIAGGFGLWRGFVAEAFSLAAWIAGVVAVRFAHPTVAAALEPQVGTAGRASLLAVAVSFGVAFLIVKLIGGRISRHMKASVLGPVDRVLGLGFGMVKGLLIATLAFLFMSLVHDVLSGAQSERPAWMTESRTYTLLRASSDALVAAVEEARGP
jgi:membrane protein required for colicin V production